MQVAAEAVNSVLVAVVGRPDTGVRDAKQHEGVLRSVLSSMQLATPALLVDGVANLTWQEVLPPICHFAGRADLHIAHLLADLMEVTYKSICIEVRQI